MRLHSMRSRRTLFARVEMLDGKELGPKHTLKVQRAEQGSSSSSAHDGPGDDDCGAGQHIVAPEQDVVLKADGPRTRFVLIGMW